MKIFCIMNWIFLAAIICLLLAIPVIGIGSTTANWHGMCYGFTDSQWSCPWWEFAKNEMFWSSLLFVPLLVMTLGTWLIVNIIQWAMRAHRRTNST